MALWNKEILINKAAKIHLDLQKVANANFLTTYSPCSKP